LGSGELVSKTGTIRDRNKVMGEIGCKLTGGGNGEQCGGTGARDPAESIKSQWYKSNANCKGKVTFQP